MTSKQGTGVCNLRHDNSETTVLCVMRFFDVHQSQLNLAGENHLVGAGYIRFAETASEDHDFNILFAAGISLAASVRCTLCLLCVFKEYRLIEITNRLPTPYNHELVNVYKVQKRYG
jgi:hypothetical protein